MEPSASRIAGKQASSTSIWAGMIAIYILWGSTYLAIRFAVQTIPPFYMAAARFLIAGTTLYVIRRLMGDPAPSKIEWRSAAVVGLFLLLGGNGGVVWAEQQVPSGLTALIIGTVPLWMIVLGIVFQKERPSKKSVAAVVIGFLGILMLFWPVQADAATTRPDLLGIGALVFGACSWAYGSLYSRKAALPKSPLLGTSMEMIVGGTGLLIFGTLAGEAGRLNFQAMAPKSLIGLAYLVIFGSFIGFTAYTWLLRVAPTSLVSTYAYVNPLVAIILGYLLANEELGLRTLLAAVVILGSVILTTREKVAEGGKRLEVESSVLPGDD